MIFSDCRLIFIVRELSGLVSTRLSLQPPVISSPGRRGPPGDAQPPGEDVQLSLQQPHLLSQLGSGGRDQGGVDTGVQTSARVDTEGVAFLGGGASQDRHQAE